MNKDYPSEFYEAPTGELRDGGNGPHKTGQLDGGHIGRISGNEKITAPLDIAKVGPRNDAEDAAAETAQDPAAHLYFKVESKNVDPEDVAADAEKNLKALGEKFNKDFLQDELTVDDLKEVEDTALIQVTINLRLLHDALKDINSERPKQEGTLLALRIKRIHTLWENNSKLIVKAMKGE